MGVHVSQGSACLIASPKQAIHPHACSTGNTIQHAFLKAPAFRKHKRIAFAWLSCVQSLFICTVSRRREPQPEGPSLLSVGFLSGRKVSYWLSFDPDSRTLKYGMGHHMEETTLLSCVLPEACGSLFETCPKLVSLHEYPGQVRLRSVYEAKLSTAGCRSEVCVHAYLYLSDSLMLCSELPGQCLHVLHAASQPELMTPGNDLQQPRAWLWCEGASKGVKGNAGKQHCSHVMR